MRLLPYLSNPMLLYSMAISASVGQRGLLMCRWHMPRKRQAAVHPEDNPERRRRRTQDDDKRTARRALGVDVQTDVCERPLQAAAGPQRSPGRAALKDVTAQVLNRAKLQPPAAERQQQCPPAPAAQHPQPRWPVRLLKTLGPRRPSSSLVQSRLSCCARSRQKWLQLGSTDLTFRGLTSCAYSSCSWLNQKDVGLTHSRLHCCAGAPHFCRR